jgi:biopolymer transport protein ExbD
MRARHRRRVSQAQVAINMTSLLDIVFVLLIAFMVVAPVLTHSMEVELPEATPPDRNVKPEERDTTMIEVRFGGAGEDAVHELFVDEVAVDGLATLETMAHAWVGRENHDVALAIDRRVPYGMYIETAAALQRAGITNYQLIYEEP